MKERSNVLTEPEDRLSTENENQKQEFERLRDIEKEADMLRINCAAVRDNIDNARTGHGCFREQPATEDNLVVLRNGMAMVTAERNSLQTGYEVVAMENNTLTRQLEELRDAGEGMKERMKNLNRAILLQLSENEDLKEELKKASA